MVNKVGDLIITTKYYNFALNQTPQGPQIYPKLLDMVDKVEDLIITKYHYSAFKGTFLLEAL